MSPKFPGFCVDCGRPVTLGSRRCRRCQGVASRGPGRRIGRADQPTITDAVRAAIAAAEPTVAHAALARRFGIGADEVARIRAEAGWEQDEPESATA